MRRYGNANPKDPLDRIERHLKGTNPLLLSLYRLYVEPYIFLCLLTTAIALFIAIICYTLKNQISVRLLWEIDYLTLTYIGFSFVILFCLGLITLTNSIRYISLNLDKYNHEKKENIAIMQISGGVYLIALILKLNGCQFLWINILLVLLLIHTVLMIVLPTAYHFSLMASICTFMIYKVLFDQMFFLYGAEEYLSASSLSVISSTIAFIWVNIHIYSKIPPKVFFESFRTQMTILVGCISITASPIALNFLMRINFIGGGLPIVIKHKDQPATHKALLVIDRKADFIAFDPETQASKIYEKSNVSWQLEKAALNSKNNNATIVSNKET